MLILVHEEGKGMPEFNLSHPKVDGCHDQGGLCEWELWLAQLKNLFN